MAETPRGRPRSQEARRAVLDAALVLCREEGYPNVTMKGIADAAGVGRQTVYRWWQAKPDVLLEALRDLADRATAEFFPDTGDALADVEQLLVATFAVNRGISGAALVGLMADAQADPALSERLQDRVIGPRRAVLREILHRGVERGQLGTGVSIDLAVDFAFGVMWYRMLSRHAPIDRALAAEIGVGLGAMLGEGRAARKTSRPPR